VELRGSALCEGPGRALGVQGPNTANIRLTIDFRDRGSIISGRPRSLRSTFTLEHVSPKQLIQTWVDAFNRADSSALAALYAEDAVNHQVAESPVQGRENIRQMFAAEFAKAAMHCIVVNLFEEGEWGILEWRDPIGLRGCGFFHVVEGTIVYQRGYWDKLSFLRQHGLPVPQR
jgi:hypothetical protein